MKLDALNALMMPNSRLKQRCCSIGIKWTANNNYHARLEHSVEALQGVGNGSLELLVGAGYLRVVKLEQLPNVWHGSDLGGKEGKGNRGL